MSATTEHSYKGLSASAQARVAREHAVVTHHVESGSRYHGDGTSDEAARVPSFQAFSLRLCRAISDKR